MKASACGRRDALALGGRAALALLIAGVAPRGAAADDAPMPVGLAVGIDALRWQDDAALSREFADYARLGASWLRTDLNWSLVQPAGPDGYDWSSMDRVLALCERHGIRLLPVVGSTPGWAAETPGRPSPPRDPEDFARFAAAAVARYRPRGVRTWEIWNEPNMSGSWPPAPDPARYARLLVAASAAMRKADTGATILSGGLASAVETGPAGAVAHHAAVDFLERIYAAGAGGAFDAVAFHPYSFPLLPEDFCAVERLVDHGGAAARRDGAERGWRQAGLDHGIRDADAGGIGRGRGGAAGRDAVLGRGPRRAGPVAGGAVLLVQLSRPRAGAGRPGDGVRPRAGPGAPKPSYAAFRGLGGEGTSAPGCALPGGRSVRE